jgi:hypothetical protein
MLLNQRACSGVGARKKVIGLGEMLSLGSVPETLPSETDWRRSAPIEALPQSNRRFSEKVDVRFCVCSRGSKLMSRRKSDEEA